MANPILHPDWNPTDYWQGLLDPVNRGFDLPHGVFRIHVFRSSGGGGVWHWNYLQRIFGIGWRAIRTKDGLWYHISEKDALFLLSLSYYEVLEQLEPIYGSVPIIPEETT